MKKNDKKKNKTLSTTIEFVNHASVIIKGNNISILSDPWFQGDAFHKGWNLLDETNDDNIDKILDKITHVWISHEHPDHFSVFFFKKFKKKLINKSIKILFQETTDKRVINFLRNEKFDCQELTNNNETFLSKSFSVTCIKDGFYDSALLVKYNNEKILNLNDCEINNLSKIDKLKLITGDIDVLLTQFSFAAWKGGKNNKKWRDEAAAEKIKTMKLQIQHFKPKIVIPFASFIYFSNIENKYLNDAANKPKAIVKNLENTSSNIIFMKPNDILGGKDENISTTKAIDFWSKRFNEINKKKFHKYEKISIDEINKNFQKYCLRIKKNNNFWLMKLTRILSTYSFFKPVKIEIMDLNCILKFDYLTQKIIKTNEKSHLCMNSESINFLFKNSFGFDTLTVNGCFEENENGFITSTKTLAIENLNNLGIFFTPRIFFNITVIKLFLERLFKVKKKLQSK